MREDDLCATEPPTDIWPCECRTDKNTNEPMTVEIFCHGIVGTEWVDRVSRPDSVLLLYSRPPDS